MGSKLKMWPNLGLLRYYFSSNIVFSKIFKAFEKMFFFYLDPDPYWKKYLNLDKTFTDPKHLFIQLNKVRVVSGSGGKFTDPVKKSSGSDRNRMLSTYGTYYGRYCTYLPIYRTRPTVLSKGTRKFMYNTLVLQFVFNYRNYYQ